MRLGVGGIVRITHLCIAAFAGSLVACGAPMADRFASVKTGVRDGMDRQQVLQIMGRPNHSSQKSVGGFDAEWIEWRDSAVTVTYTVALIQGRAVFKSSNSSTITQEK